MTHLVLPWCPSTNHVWRPITKYNPRTRKHYAEFILSAAAKRYYLETPWIILAQRPRQHSWPYRHPISLTLTLSPPDKKRHDVDNICKVSFDVLVKSGVIEDDSLVQELHLYRCPPIALGTIDVCIEVLG